MRFLAFLHTLPIQIDNKTTQQAMSDILTLARKLRLSSYDAAYLELAIREGIHLATLDQKLKKAAARMGVTIMSGA